MINYKNVEHGHRVRGGAKLPMLISVGAVMLIVMTYLIFSMLLTQYSFNRFKADLVSGIVYARNEDSFEMLDGGTVISREVPESTRKLIAVNGRPISSDPEEPAKLTLVYGNGSVTELWPCEYTDHSGIEDEVVHGMIIVHTRSDGKVYRVETDNDFYSVKACLLGYVENIYKMTKAEQDIVEELRNSDGQVG